MPEKADKEAANWMKAYIGLTITKNGLTLAIINIFETFLLSFTPEERRHLPKFLKNILEEETSDVDVKYIEKGNGLRCSWKITGKCPCGMRLCQKILDCLCKQHVNNSKNVVWRHKAKESKLHSRNANKTKQPYTPWFAERCSICRDFNCPFQRNRQGVPMFSDEVSHKVVNIYWPLANMYMFRGKEKNNFPNTGPEDTDAALMLKLMKNCKLFLIDEDDVDNGIYDELLEVRNMLMHSADNRLSDDVLDECFDSMKKILNAKKFSNDYSQNAIRELEKLKDMRIIMTSRPSEQLAIVQDSLNVQQSSLKYDINVTGSLKHDYVLEDFLKASTDKCKMYTENAKQTYVSTLGGAATGAALGSVAGPPGAAIGAVVGWLFGKLAE